MPQPATARLLPLRSPGAAPPLALRPIRYRHEALPAQSDAAVAKTIRYMNALASGTEGARSPRIRQLALAVTARVPNRDSAGEISALHGFVQRDIAFRGEPGEMVQSPETTYRLRAGDCDDHATLLAALLQSIGYKTHFVTVAGDASAPREFSHVYLEAQNRQTGQWIPLDTTEPKAQPGWQPKRVSRRRTWLGGLGQSAAPAYPLTQGQAFAYDLAQTFGQPLVQAESQRIAYPQGTALFANSTALGVNLSSWFWIGLLGLGAVAVARSMGGRR